MLSASFRNDSVKLVEVGIKVKDCHVSVSEANNQNNLLTVHGDPFHDIAVLGQHHDGFEVPFDERSVCERTGEVQRFPIGAAWRRGS